MKWEIGNSSGEYISRRPGGSWEGAVMAVVTNLSRVVGEKGRQWVKSERAGQKSPSFSSLLEGANATHNLFLKMRKGRERLLLSVEGRGSLCFFTAGSLGHYPWPSMY